MQSLMGRLWGIEPDVWDISFSYPHIKKPGARKVQDWAGRHRAGTKYRMTNTKDYIGKRAAATIIDYTIIFVLTFTYIWFVGEPNQQGGKTVTGLPALAPLAFWFLYFVVAENSYSSTLGHKLVGLKVVSLDYSKVTFGQILKRRLADIIEISWCFGLIAFLVARGNDKSQRVGDLLGKTIVVGKNDLAENFEFDFESAS